MNNNLPPAMPNGATGNAPAAPPQRQPPSKAAILLARKRRAGNPLVARKPPKPLVKPPPPQNPLPKGADSEGRLRVLTGVTSGPSVPHMANAGGEKALQEFEKVRAANNGWGQPVPPDAQNHADYPLTTTKRALKEAMRVHIMKLKKTYNEGKNDDIDPTNQDQFTRPVSLVRRDPKQPPPGRAVKPEDLEEEDEMTPEAAAAAAKDAQAKAEKAAQRAIDQAQIAPSLSKDGKKAVAKKDKPFINGGVKSSRFDQGQRQLGYEEHLPWHLEDADGKNVWVGHYIANLSHNHVAFVVQGSGFTMVPLEKYYQFKSQPPFKRPNIDEVEKMVGKPALGALNNWNKRQREKALENQELSRTRAFLGARPRIKGESATSRGRNASERFARDELDLEGDGAFSDDDDMVGLEPDNDEDAKESRVRVRNDHLGANLFGEADEKEVAEQEAEEDKEKEQRDEHGRRLRKALIKLEGHGDYLEEDDDFDDTSSDEEEQKKEEEKTDESKDKTDGDVTMSGTGSSAKVKAADKKGKSLKRPGSPNLSESSGNESSRKKKQKKDPAASVRASRAGTPSLGRKAGGATSDGEGEMSDGGAKRKMKNPNLTAGTGPRGTPTGSRAGSPAPAGRAASPGSPLGSPAQGAVPARIADEEIIAEMRELIKKYPEGVKITMLFKPFKGRYDGPGQMTKGEVISAIRRLCQVVGNPPRLTA